MDQGAIALVIWFMVVLFVGVVLAFLGRRGEL